MSQVGFIKGQTSFELFLCWPKRLKGLRFIFLIFWFCSLAIPAGRSSASALPCLELIQEIEPVFFRGLWIRQLSICTERGTCVLWIDKPTLSNKNLIEEISLLFSRHGKIVDHPDSQNSAVNCMSFACQQMGFALPPNAWINDPSSFLNLVRSEYQTVPFVIWSGDVVAFEESEELREGDVMLLTDLEKILHVGILVTEGSQLWVLSKMGEGFVAKFRYQELIKYFPDAVGTKFLRRKDSPLIPAQFQLLNP